MSFRISSLCWLLLLIIFGFSNRSVEFEHVFVPGESLTYKLKYGWLSIGKGSFQIKEQEEEYDGYTCYRVIARGSSSGPLKWFAPVEDEWGAVVRKHDLTPLYTFRNIREGRYQLNEEVFIDPKLGTIRVESVKPHRKKKRRPTKYYEFDAENQIYDLISGLLAIREIDFDQEQEGDTLELKAFFEDTMYDFEVVYAGKENINTKFGPQRTLKLIPLMPENSVFDGKHALEVWFSADQNRLPLKISAEMFIGRASAELIDYQNIKYELGSK